MEKTKKEKKERKTTERSRVQRCKPRAKEITLAFAASVASIGWRDHNCSSVNNGYVKDPVSGGCSQQHEPWYGGRKTARDIEYTALRYRQDRSYNNMDNRQEIQ